MKGLITGASSGLGRDMATILSAMGYDLILVARQENKLNELKKSLGVNVTVFALDLSVRENCFTLFENVKNEDIDILINNAGFGLFGRFDETDLETELNMIDLNIASVHILTKLFLKKFEKSNKGYILNIASSAAFLPGPLMSVYYATKAYVLRLTSAIYEELRRNKSNVYIGALCPGPVDTNFNSVAGVSFALKGLKSIDVAKYALNKMFKKKTVIIPGRAVRLGVFSSRFLPTKPLLKISYNIQRKKDN